MPIVLVSLDGGTPTMRTVQQRTAQLSGGVLCEICVDERFQLCLVERVNADGSIVARRLPEPELGTTSERPRRREPGRQR